MKIEIKSLQTYPRLSDETLAFNANVYVDGVFTCRAENHGRGGCNFYETVNEEKMKLLEAYAKEIHKEFTFEQLDILLDDIIHKMDEEKSKIKQFKRWCKKGTYFRIKGDKEGGWRTLSHKGTRKPMLYTPQVKEWLTKTYGDTIEEILNEKY